MLFKNVLNSIALACMATSSVASPIAHLHHAHKREVVHVTETVLVTVGGGNTDFANAPAATQTTISETQSTGTQTAYEYQVTVADSASSTANFETQAAAIGTSTSSAAASTETSSSSAFSAGSKGITYSPYNDDGTCKDLSSVKSDLAKLADYELIRLYGVDCNQVANVFQSKADGQKLFLGIFDVADLASGIQTISSAVSSYGSWDDVHTVSIGNELVNDGEASVAQIGEYVSSAKSLLSSAGYSGSVVSVDTHVAIINNPGLCEFSDYIAFNAHAYWDGSIVGENAGAWLLLQMQRVWSVCNKNVMCVESGWPHSGDTNGVAVASSSEQAAAISSIQSTCGDDTIVFTAFDDLWKSPGSLGVEQYWGIY
ncbi:hypothetical protein C6P40_005296 [Pichia californica]|uniref:Uncharacterized protein n=1 Tax=Pichia californica TaxID=460514 RepID=A0A9P7BI66_9ASCO|nr:hypothetical protein C6P42_000091 [[Candida] californica]KAG0691069.1 hypothetical protein C6P40_005296 [[Candida] californica]